MEVAAAVVLIAIGIVIVGIIYRRRSPPLTRSKRSASASDSVTSASSLSTKGAPQSVPKAAKPLHHSIAPRSASAANSSSSAQRFGGVPANRDLRNLTNAIRANPNKKYLAVGVRPQLHCCRAVMAMENIRFLAEDAPHFPVAGCQFNACRCQYIYFSDRRDDERRTIFGAARSILPANLASDRRRQERRKNSC